MGRWGMHKEAPSQEIKISSMEVAPQIEWSEAALKILDGIPPFARDMTKSSIENRARNTGVGLVNKSLVLAISEKMDMKKESSNNDKSR